MRLGFALFLALTMAGAAAAQTAGSSEYGRTDGGDVALLLKQSNTLSGSFGFTFGKSDVSSKALNGTVGGALVPDRLWFFAAGQRDSRPFLSPALPQMPATLPSSLLSLRTTAAVSSHSFFSASVTSRQTQPAFFTHW